MGKLGKKEGIAMGKELPAFVVEKGRVSFHELAVQFEQPVEIVKESITREITNQTLQAYLANGGNEVITVKKLEVDVLEYVNKKGILPLTELGGHFKVTTEVARLTLVRLLKDRRLKGLFTQMQEFITDEALRGKLKALARTHRNMSITQMANHVHLMPENMEDILATMIGNSQILGYIDMGKREFVFDAEQPPEPAVEEERRRVERQKLESDRLEKLKKIVKVSKGLLLDDLAQALGITRAALMDKVFDWAAEFGFEIDENKVVFGAGKKDDFLAQLDKELASWGKESSGKV